MTLTKHDKQILDSISLSENDLNEELGKFEEGDFSDFDFSKTIDGRPIEEEKFQMVSAPIAASRLVAIKRITSKQGISRSEFIRKAVDHELLNYA